MQLNVTNIPPKPMDYTEWAYNSIKELILNNVLTAGTQINIDEMAAQLNVSRTPVREALLRLKNKGLVRIVPHVGCFVCSITREEFREVFELRRIIETYAARCAAENMSDEELAHWKDYVSRSEKAVLAGNLVEFNNMETLIHNSLIENLNNKRILEVMDMIGDNIYRQRMLALKSRDNIEKSLEEHRRIVEALISHKPDEAALAMETHIHNVERRIEKIVFDTDNT